ncbi:voltage-gated potassium channel [Pholiota conissans]|uniref:Voltage-gated potassium channel n=1 Tax=Pholiota conissans TaxID=109636 RepID=A0A9P5ZF35_9AGAR|nr:voltage-gated potassium channel [Pholiota conissans]
MQRFVRRTVRAGYDDDNTTEKLADDITPTLEEISNTNKPRRRPDGLDLDERQDPRPLQELESATKNDDAQNRAEYRNLPIFSGIMIPFSIMLSIPSLTGHWYVRTGDEHELLEVRPNPVLLDVAMGFSMACGILANICLVIRFSERRIKLMTALCIMFLSLHDIINIPAVTIFGVIHRFDDGFTYGQSFWLTVCSTIFSTATNFTLIFDYLNTRDFTHSGSGLTHKQRSLVIIIIILLCYISLGSLLLGETLNISFLDALYLSIVSIETIGFGDLHPDSTGTRILACIYISGGILNLALLVALSREALLEGAAATVQQRMAKARTHARERNIRTRWRAAIHWRLRAKGLHTWVDDRDEEQARSRGSHSRRHQHWYAKLLCLWRQVKSEVWREWEDPAWKYVYGHRHKRLNLEALSEAELETAALEAGLPLSELIPKGLKLQGNDSQDSNDSVEDESDSALTNWQNPGASHPSLTHVRMIGMISLLNNFALAYTNGLSELGQDSPEQSDTEDTTPTESIRPHLNVPFTRSLTTTMTMADEDYNGVCVPESLETVEKNAFYTRLVLSLSLFVIFWMAGSAIFMKTEGWPFGAAMYFCFVSFSTVGYGDFSPKTPAGRSIFIVWALLGVGTMTILISILAEAYSKSYKSVINTEIVMSTTETFSETLASSTGYQQRLLDSRDLSTPSGGKDQGSLNSSSSSSLTAASDSRSSILLSSPSYPSPGPRLPRSPLRTVMLPIPEDTDIDADVDGTTTEPALRERVNLAALPAHVLRHVDHLMSIIGTASRNNSPSRRRTGMNGQGEVSRESEHGALLREIQKHLAHISNAAKDAQKDTVATPSVTFSS